MPDLHAINIVQAQAPLSFGCICISVFVELDVLEIHTECLIASALGHSGHALARVQARAPRQIPTLQGP